jgi:hypothetical protein
MKVTTPYFVHLRTFTPEGPELQGFPQPEPVSKNKQIASTQKIFSYNDPWNLGPKPQPVVYKFKNNDGRIEPMMPTKNEFKTKSS